MRGNVPYLSLDDEGVAVRVVAEGEWVLSNYQEIEREVLAVTAQVAASGQRVLLQGETRLPTIDHLDLQHLAALDTAGAAQLARLLGSSRLQALLQETIDLAPERRAL